MTLQLIGACLVVLVLGVSIVMRCIQDHRKWNKQFPIRVAVKK